METLHKHPNSHHHKCGAYFEHIYVHSPPPGRNGDTANSKQLASQESSLKQLHSSPLDEMDPASIVAFTGGVLGPLGMLLYHAEPFLNLLRRFVGCLHNPQPRPRRPVRAPWKRDWCTSYIRNWGNRHFSQPTREKLNFLMRFLKPSRKLDMYEKHGFQ